MRCKRKKKRYQGFTLVEMLVVLVIISVLVLLFIPNLGKSKDSLLEGSNEIVIESILTEIELAEFKAGYKLTEAEIVTLLGSNTERLKIYEAYKNKP